MQKMVLRSADQFFDAFCTSCHHRLGPAVVVNQVGNSSPTNFHLKIKTVYRRWILDHYNYALVASRQRKWGASSLKIGWDCDKFLWADMQNDSISRCVHPANTRNNLNINTNNKEDIIEKGLFLVFTQNYSDAHK